MNTIRQNLIATTLLSLLLAVVFVLFSSATISAEADSLQEICARNPDAAVCEQYEGTRDDTAGDNTVLRFLGEVVQILLFGLGIAGIIGVIAGGLYYVISAGEPQKAEQAKKIIIYSLVGVLIGFLSQLIITFVLDRLEL